LFLALLDRLGQWKKAGIKKGAITESAKNRGKGNDQSQQQPSVRRRKVPSGKPESIAKLIRGPCQGMYPAGFVSVHTHITDRTTVDDT
jgi:hypothetical protein